MKKQMREIDGPKFCMWRMCSTNDEGKHEAPKSCSSKKCPGGPFMKAPLCETFYPDLTMHRQETPVYDIRAARERRRHEFILKHAEPISAHAAVKKSRA